MLVRSFLTLRGTRVELKKTYGTIVGHGAPTLVLPSCRLVTLKIIVTIKNKSIRHDRTILSSEYNITVRLCTLVGYLPLLTIRIMSITTRTGSTRRNITRKMIGSIGEINPTRGYPGLTLLELSGSLRIYHGGQR